MVNMKGGMERREEGPEGRKEEGHEGREDTKGGRTPREEGHAKG
jgi:hypothetical protein